MVHTVTVIASCISGMRQVVLASYRRERGAAERSGEIGIRAPRLLVCVAWNWDSLYKLQQHSELSCVRKLATADFTMPLACSKECKAHFGLANWLCLALSAALDPAVYTCSCVF